MVEGSTVALAAAAVVGAEVTGVTDLTGSGDGGGGGGGGSPLAGLGRMQERLANLQSAVDAAGETGDVVRNITSPGGGSPGDVAIEVVESAASGASDGFTSEVSDPWLPDVGGGSDTGGSDTGGSGTSGGGPFSGFEEKARAGGENIGSGLGGGAGNVFAGGVESFGNAVLSPYREKGADIKETWDAGTEDLFGDSNAELLLGDPLGGAVRNKTPGDTVNMPNINIGGSDTGGSDTGGSDTGGSDTGGSDTGGSGVGGFGGGGYDNPEPDGPERSEEKNERTKKDPDAGWKSWSRGG